MFKMVLNSVGVPVLALLVGAATGAPAQGQNTTGWTISNIKLSVLKKIEGTFVDREGARATRTTITRTAEKGSIIEVTGTFSFAAAPITIPEITGDNILITGRAASAGTGPTVAVPDIKLSGIEPGGNSWSFEPIAVGLNSNTRCSSYYFLDSKNGGFAVNRSNGSEAVGFELKGKALFLSGASVPLCLAFPAPATRQQMRLEFAGTQVSIQ